METLEHEWIVAGCPGSPLKQARLTREGTDPLASPLVNRNFKFKVSSRPTSNLPPAALQLASQTPVPTDRRPLDPTRPSVHSHRPQARRNRHLRVAQLADIATSHLSGAFDVERNLRVSGHSHGLWHAHAYTRPWGVVFSYSRSPTAPWPGRAHPIAFARHIGRLARVGVCVAWPSPDAAIRSSRG